MEIENLSLQNEKNNLWRATELLERFIFFNISGSSSQIFSIEYLSPWEVELDQGLKLSIYLYNVSENIFFKNQEPLPRGINKFEIPPMVMDLRYILTPITKEPKDHQEMLSDLIMLFHNNSSLSIDEIKLEENEDNKKLKEILLRDGNSELKVIIENLPLDSISQIWNMSQTKNYKVGLPILVTPFTIRSNLLEDTTRVLHKKNSVYEQKITKQGN
jgi:hypothetical protein